MSVAPQKIGPPSETEGAGVGKSRSQYLCLLYLLAAAILLLSGVIFLGTRAGQEVSRPNWLPYLLPVLVILNLLTLLLVFYFFHLQLKGRRQTQAQLKEYQEQLQYLASQLSLAEERERRRLAVFLHDHIGQKLAIISIKLGQIRALVGPGNGNSLPEQLDDLRQLVKQTIQETKSVTFQISSPILYELGLEAALEWLAEETQKKYGLITYFEDDRQSKPVATDLQILLFQAVNELLMNVVKHAHARQVQISIWREGPNLRLGVYDDGIGFTPKQLDWQQGRKSGFGLFSIRERLRPFGGRLDLQSQPGLGTQVIMTVPLRLPEVAATHGDQDYRGG